MHAGCQLLDGEPGVLLQGTQDGEVGLVKCIHERKNIILFGECILFRNRTCVLFLPANIGLFSIDSRFLVRYFCLL